MQHDAPIATANAAPSDSALARRRLLLRDSLIFLVLTLITAALFVFTLLLFRSFATHRAVLATRWAQRGSAALAAGHPEEAITALRTALTYAPGEQDDQLLLAQALGAAGHTEESANYFLNLWELTPGDGFINLQLARLARQTGSQDSAVRYYRAAIYGSWQQDAMDRRRAVRFELLHYLIAQHDFTTARNELLIASSDAPRTPESDIAIAGEFLAIDDPANALAWYQKALLEEPHNSEALDGAGRLSAQLGDAPAAMDYLQRALEAPPRRGPSDGTKLATDQRTSDETLLTQLQQAEAAQKKTSKDKRRSR